MFVTVYHRWSMSKLEVRLLTSEHAADVRSLLLNSFFLQEPLNERFGYNLPDEVEDFLDISIKNAIKDQCSFVFVDEKRVAGVILNRILNRNDPSNEKLYQSKTLRYIYKLLDLLHEKQSVFDYFQVDRVLYTAIISVDADYRGQRLSEKLVEQSLKMAKENLNVQAAFTETTSHFSLKAFLKMGFQVINEIVYETYDEEKLSKMGVHDRCSLVGRKLID